MFLELWNGRLLWIEWNTSFNQMHAAPLITVSIWLACTYQLLCMHVNWLNLPLTTFSLMTSAPDIIERVLCLDKTGSANPWLVRFSDPGISTGNQIPDCGGTSGSSTHFYFACRSNLSIYVTLYISLLSMQCVLLVIDPTPVLQQEILSKYSV